RSPAGFAGPRGPDRGDGVRTGGVGARPDPQDQRPGRGRPGTHESMNRGRAPGRPAPRPRTGPVRIRGPTGTTTCRPWRNHTECGVRFRFVCPDADADPTAGLAESYRTGTSAESGLSSLPGDRDAVCTGTAPL